jgi:hypothetical protein
MNQIPNGYTMDKNYITNEHQQKIQQHQQSVQQPQQQSLAYPPLPNHIQNEWHTVIPTTENDKETVKSIEKISIKRRNKSTG